MKNLYDKILGRRVKQHLINLGLEQPRKYNTDSEAKISKITKSYRDILDTIGLVSSEFDQTPFRIARMFVDEVFSGLDYDNFISCTTYKNDLQYSGIVTQKNITIMSFCEHHFIPFQGVIEISFIPKNNIIGLYCLNSICDFFSRRPQIQERMTAQIFESLKFILKTNDISVKVVARHTCISYRNNNNNTETYTEMLGGLFDK